MDRSDLKIDMNDMIMTDSPIRFPGLFGDWTFTASSKAIDVGHGVYWYGILIALGLLLALLLCMKERVKYGISEDNLYDGLLWGIPLGIVGARVYYVLFYLDRFRTSDGKFDFGSAIAFWDGGLAIYGTVIAVIILAVCLSRRKGKRGFKFFAMTDLVVMGLLVGQIVGRWGNFMNREAFGSETTCLFRMQLTTKAGQLIEVHPTFLYESVWNLVGLLLLLFVCQSTASSTGRIPGSISFGMALAVFGWRVCARTACICSTGSFSASPSGCPRPSASSWCW